MPLPPCLKEDCSVRTMGTTSLCKGMCSMLSFGVGVVPGIGHVSGYICSIPITLVSLTALSSWQSSQL